MIKFKDIFPWGVEHTAFAQFLCDSTIEDFYPMEMPVDESTGIFLFFF